MNHRMAMQVLRGNVCLRVAVYTGGINPAVCVPRVCVLFITHYSLLIDDRAASSLAGLPSNSCVLFITYC